MQRETAGTSELAGRRNIIVIGASSGGLEVLTRLVSGLPAHFPAALLVVVHIPPHARSILPELLSRAGRLPAAHPQDAEPLLPGRIYVAPPDRHLIVEPGVVRLSAGPRENHARPAADPLFRSAALSYGRRVIGVVLSGALSDGTAGLWEIKQHGGTAVVQDPGDAMYPSMPHTAMDQVPVDHVVPAAEMAGLLLRLVSGQSEERPSRETLEMAPANRAVRGGPAMSENQPVPPVDDKPGSDAVDRDTAAQVAGERDGATTVYVCPECGGTLWQVNAGNFSRFRCHVGHVYGGEDLLEGYTGETERALWTVIRTLRDKANLLRQLGSAAHERGAVDAARQHDETARRDDEYAGEIEKILAAAVAANRGHLGGSGR